VQALRHCLEAGARIVEVDITPLHGGGFALLHDMKLEKATDGSGYTFATTADQVARMHYMHQGSITKEPVGLLYDTIELVQEFPKLQELQLDLKPHAPMTDAILTDLITSIAPVKCQVRITSVADWVLHQLYLLDGSLSLGFDPLLYLDVDEDEEPDETTPPYKVGAYGYRDDHALASHLWGASRDYLNARAEGLCAMVPAGVAFYIRAQLLAQAQEDGFDWITFLHARNTPIAAWTLDAEDSEHVALAERLVAAGIDRVTTNDAPRLAQALGCSVLF
jgi:glycerophosphoryl diester phosphodiesterase